MSGLPPVPVTELADRAVQQFTGIFGRPPGFVAAAPGRVNLIGGHVDYNDGIVLPLAIDRYTVVAGGTNSGTVGEILSDIRADARVRVSLDELVEPVSGDWSNYARGVIAGFQQKGMTIPGFDAVIHSSVPVGAGLSSSAALEVALATLIEALTGEQLEPRDKALLCQQAEHDFAGVPCGLMDQLTSIFGQADHLLQIDCRSLEIETLAWPSAEIAILLVNTHADHQLVDGEYALRRRQCQTALEKLGRDSFRDVTLDWLHGNRGALDDIEYRRALHVVTETDRVRQAAEAIRRCDWRLLGELLLASHQSSRDNFEVSCAELDLLVEQATQLGADAGIFGMRLTGAGFGGCTVALVQPECVAQVVPDLTSAFDDRFGHRPTTLVTRPAEGAFLSET